MKIVKYSYTRNREIADFFAKEADESYISTTEIQWGYTNANGTKWKRNLKDLVRHELKQTKASNKETYLVMEGGIIGFLYCTFNPDMLRCKISY